MVRHSSAERDSYTEGASAIQNARKTILQGSVFNRHPPDGRWARSEPALVSGSWQDRRSSPGRQEIAVDPPEFRPSTSMKRRVPQSEEKS